MSKLYFNHFTKQYEPMSFFKKFVSNTKSIMQLGILGFLLFIVVMCGRNVGCEPTHVTTTSLDSLQTKESPVVYEVKPKTPMPDAIESVLMFPEAVKYIVSKLDLPEGVSRYNDALLMALDKKLKLDFDQLVKANNTEEFEFDLLNKEVYDSIDVDKYMNDKNYREEILMKVLNI